MTPEVFRKVYLTNVALSVNCGQRGDLKRACDDAEEAFRTTIREIEERVRAECAADRDALRDENKILSGHLTAAIDDYNDAKTNSDALRAEVERLRDALTFYRDAGDYEKSIDCGDIARATLSPRKSEEGR